MSSYFELLDSIDNYVLYICQVLAFVYALLCIFWLVYVICILDSKVRIKRRLVTLMYTKSELDYANHLFLQSETILRNSIFLVFLCFELVYYIITSLCELLSDFIPPPQSEVTIDPTCTLFNGTFLAQAYDNSWPLLLVKFFGWLIRDISFSMLIWMFGASLLHLSYAAKNIINANVIFRFSLIGLIVNTIMAVPIMIPYTSLFGKVAQSLMNQFSFFLVLYIANRKFFPAMNSRIIDAFHFNNTVVYLQQKKILSRYKALIYFLLFSFELYILKDLFIYKLYLTFQSICDNSCWFRVTLSLPEFTISNSVNILLLTINEYLLLLTHLIDLMFYINIIAVNLIFVFIILLKCIKRIDIYNRKKYRYRYQVFSASLLS